MSERVKLKLRAWKKMEEKRGGKLGEAKTVEYTKEGTAETLSDDLNQLLITDGFTGVNITGRGKLAMVHWNDHFTSFSGCVIDQASNRMVEVRCLDDVKAYFTLDGAEYTNLIETLTRWQQEAMEQHIAEMQKRFPNIKVEMKTMTAEELANAEKLPYAGTEAERRKAAGV